MTHKIPLRTSNNKKKKQQKTLVIDVTRDICISLWDVTVHWGRLSTNYLTLYFFEFYFFPQLPGVQLNQHIYTVLIFLYRVFSRRNIVQTFFFQREELSVIEVWESFCRSLLSALVRINIEKKH